MSYTNKIDKKNLQDILALTPLQEGILFHYLLDPQDGQYFGQLSLEISGDINVNIFKQTWNLIVESNEMLRTVFRWEMIDNPVQIIKKKHDINLVYHNFSKLDNIQKQKQVKHIIKKDRENKFNLQDVPFRITLCKIQVKGLIGMEIYQTKEMGSQMSTLQAFCVILFLSVFLGLSNVALAKSAPANAPLSSQQDKEEDELKEWNNQIRREKFDLVLPEAMRKNNVEMWIHVMREAIPDPFGAEELGSTSGVFIFTDRGGDRIERAILGRRWGASHRGRVEWETKLVEECGAYEIIGDPVRVQQPVGGPMTEYDYRFKGLREFVVARDPKRIALNFKKDLGPFVTFRGTYAGATDGISYTDYLLLTEELGDEYANRLVSSEYVIMDYIIRKVPSEIELLKRIRKDRVERAKKAFAGIVPGVTKNREAGVTLFSRRSTGLSQRGRSPGYENSVIQGGDIVASPSQGMYAYVLREGETEPPPEIKKLWAEYLKIDKILAETIKVGLTPREIIRNYTRKFEEAGIIVRDNQLHMVIPKNNFPVYSAGFDPDKTHLSIDCHGMMKGARERPNENYFGPRIGSLGPDWQKDIPLPPNHHFVLEYFFYMPSPASEGEDQYLFWWDHEQAIATEKGVEYLSPPQKEIYLVK